MNKFILITLMILMLAGCETETREVHGYIMPEGLKDCKIYSLSKNGSHIIVTRCPNSSTSTTYRNGKTLLHSSVVEQEN